MKKIKIRPSLNQVMIYRHLRVWKKKAKTLVGFIIKRIWKDDPEKTSVASERIFYRLV